MRHGDKAIGMQAQKATQEPYPDVLYPSVITRLLRAPAAVEKDIVSSHIRGRI